jgi:hypothetical protein
MCIVKNMTYVMDITRCFVVFKAAIYSRYIRFTKIQCTLEILLASPKIWEPQYLVWPSNIRKALLSGLRTA